MHAPSPDEEDLEAPLLNDRRSVFVNNPDPTDFLKQAGSEPFNIDNPTHAEKLRHLWYLAFGHDPEGSPELPADPKWKRLGFQSNTPATDFRGGGVFSLDMVIFFFQNNPEEGKKMLNDTSGQNGYPFVPACINVTVLILHHLSLTNCVPPVDSSAASARRKRMMLSILSQNIKEAFGFLFMHVMMKLHNMWLIESQKPDHTLLQFGRTLELTAICVRTLVNNSDSMENPSDFDYVMDVNPESWYTWISNSWDYFIDCVHMEA